MNIYFTAFYIIFLVSALLYQMMVEHKVDEAGKSEKGKVHFVWTHRLINFTYLGVIILPVIEYFLVKRRINPGISLAGVIMVVSGICGRNYSIKFLGRYWSGDIEIKKEHRVIKEGPYAYVRHPAYLSMIMNGIGLCLIPNSYYSLLLAFFCYIPALLLRIYLEETVFVRELGEEYLDYKKEVYALLPFKRVKRRVAK